jgi:succinyl-CoA synthetase beta subunit
LEYEVKDIFRREGIPCPTGRVASTPEEAREVADSMGKPVVLKVQIPVGGRGRSGGIRFASAGEEVEKIAGELIGKEYQGHVVHSILVEERLKIEAEMYLGVINDRAAKAPAVLVSSEGGIEVEEIARRYPEKLARRNVDIWKGLQEFESRVLTKKAGVPRELIRGVSGLLHSLYWNVYRGYDAVYTEVNPLCLTEGGQLVATDARLYIDDNAMYRHGDVSPEEQEKWNERERVAHEKGFGYVELNDQGEVACIANGAALGMSAMDYINEATKPGTLACFLDVGGRFYDLAGDALRLVMTLPNLEAVLIHSYGGMTRAERLAESVCRAIEDVIPRIPIFVELSGTGEKGAIDVMKRSAQRLRELNVAFEWSSHTVSGTEEPSARKVGVDVLETPVKRVVEWIGHEYRRNPPDWLKAHPDWEATTRKLMRECLALRPEPEYQELARYE